MRRPVEERRGQPRGPQIRRQLAEIHVIVAGDEPLSHVILRSMDVSPRRAATGRSYRVPPLSRTHYPYLELQVLERDGRRGVPLLAAGLTDARNYDVGHPAPVYQLRGLCQVDVEVQGLHQASSIAIDVNASQFPRSPVPRRIQEQVGGYRATNA